MNETQWLLIVHVLLEWTDKHCGHWNCHRSETLRDDMKFAVEEAPKAYRDAVERMPRTSTPLGTSGVKEKE